MRLVKVMVRVCAVAGCVALVTSHLGGLHPVGDSLAVFRLWIACAVAALGCLALCVNLRWVGVAAVLGGFWAAVPIWGAARPADGVGAPSITLGAPQSLYQKNLRWLNAEPERVLGDIRARAPDHVTLQEVHDGGTAIVFENLPEDYVARHICEAGGVGAVAVASRFPMVPDSAFCDWGHVIAAMQVETAEGPVWVASIHLTWPWPYGQAEQLLLLDHFLPRIDGPALIGGDFNMVPWSHAVTEIARQTDTHVIGPIRGTRPTTALGLNLALDHVLVTGGHGHIAHRPMLGSDHVGLIAEVRLPMGARDDVADR